MRRIALTGGIATGKSHVAARFRDAGVPVIDADVLARQAVAPGTPGLAAIVKRFGRDILTPEGFLDRRRLGDIVFQDAAARQDLESIVHPIVRRAMEEFFDTLPDDTPFALADVPLLYETGREHRFNRVIVVACSPAAQVERIMARDGLSREAAERRIASQLPIEEKVKKADDVITTDGTHAETNKQVDALMQRLNKPQADERGTENDNP